MKSAAPLVDSYESGLFIDDSTNASGISGAAFRNSREAGKDDLEIKTQGFGSFATERKSTFKQPSDFAERIK